MTTTTSSPMTSIAARSGLPPPSRSIAGKVEHVLPRLAAADVVVLNPPRGGVHTDVTEYLENSRTARAIAYVSCDPATLARDVSRLPSYDLRTVRAFDMFPQTAHVETVCILVLNERATRSNNEISS